MAGFRGIGINPKRFHKSQIKFYIILLPVALFMILPIIFIFAHAFKPIDELFAYPPRFLAKRPTIMNFVELFITAKKSGIPISRYLFNSILITVVTIVSTIWLSVSAGYVLSKKKFKGKDTIFAINTLALMFVPIAVTIPRYLIIEKLGLLDTFWAHIFPALAMPVGLFLVKQFIDQIPDSLIEAGWIDGASDYQIITKLIVPIVKPALSTVAILAFQSAWNSTEASTLLINDDSLKTFSFYLSTLASAKGNTVAGQGMTAASSLIMFLPNLMLFIFFQSRVMNTMVHSGIK